MKVKRWRRTLTGRVGPMGVRTGVGGRAVVPQGGVALTAMGRREGDGTAKLAVRTGGRNKPTTYWLHRREETEWSQVRGTECDTKSDELIKRATLTLRVSRLLVFIHIFSYIFGISSEKKKKRNDWSYIWTHKLLYVLKTSVKCVLTSPLHLGRPWQMGCTLF